MAIVDAAFPFECDAGSYGNDRDRSTQSSPRCSGRCPPGYHCPGATVVPIRCRPGTYCVEGSAAETLCPSGTFSSVSGLQSDAGCQTCRAGTVCAAGSDEESPCLRGTYAPFANSTTCLACEPGTFQDQTGRTECKICAKGFFCPRGAAAQLPCLAGTYSDVSGISNISQCKVSAASQRTFLPAAHDAQLGPARASAAVVGESHRPVWLTAFARVLLSCPPRAEMQHWLLLPCRCAPSHAVR